MPKNIPTMFFICHNEFQGPLRCWCRLCEICNCTCHLYIIIASSWNRHSYNPKEVSTWMEDFCSGQTCKERCKTSIKKVILPLLPLCSVSISCDGIMQKPLQSSSFPPRFRPGNLWLWEQETSEIQAKLNIGKQDQNHHLVQTPGEFYRCLV